MKRSVISGGCRSARDDDLDRLGGGAQPRGKIYSIADDSVFHAFLCTHVAGEHFAAVEAEPEAHRRLTLTFAAPDSPWRPNVGW